MRRLALLAADADPVAAPAARGRAGGRAGRVDPDTLDGLVFLESVMRDYAGVSSGAIRDVVARHGLTYARVNLDSTPVRHAPAY